MSAKPSNELDPALAARSYITGDKPIRPKIQVYPINNEKEKRRFRSYWYNWLEYSVSKDSAFCFACRKFSIEVGCSSTNFVLEGSFFDVFIETMGFYRRLFQPFIIIPG